MRPAKILTWIRRSLGIKSKPIESIANSRKRDKGSLPHPEAELLSVAAALAHDFRGPLASVRGFAETLQDKSYSVSDEERQEFLRIIIKNVAVLERLVSNLLDVQRLDSQALMPLRERIPIVEFTANVLERLQGLASTKEVTLLLSTSLTNEVALADSVMIERVMVNIIENAIRYSSSGGEVTVSLGSKKEGVLIEIQDKGIGIPAEALPHIGEPFFRVNRDRSKRTGGTGLGLSIAKRILEAHGSNLEVTSEVGVGTVMRFLLPTPEVTPRTDSVNRRVLR